MSQLSRREVLKLGLAGAGGLALFPSSRLFAAPSDNSDPNPHFYLHLYLQGGADQTYLFDARPLEMTKAGKIHNYLGVEPALWTGANGVSCLATSVVDALAPYKNDFSVLNGVLVTPSAPGHDQNANQFFTGNEFGGESFVPHLNLGDTGREPKALDAITSGMVFANLENLAGSVPFDVKSGDKLRGLLKEMPKASPGSELIDFIRSRYHANARGRGRFALGATQMLSGLDRSPDLHGRITQLRAPNPALPAELQFASLIGDCFRLSIARSAVWVLNASIQDLDSHAPDQAKKQPATLQALIAKIAAVLKHLKDTPFDSRRSLWDVTTVVVTSEFGRTMRGFSGTVDNTGTDHNNLTTTCLIGGKGIRGGLVLGATDWTVSDEKLSGAHKVADPLLLKTMARPFDFKTWTTRTDLPEKFEIQDYLTVNSVVNTIYKNFGSPVARYHKLGRNLPEAPTLDVLLKS